MGSFIVFEITSFSQPASSPGLSFMVNLNSAVVKIPLFKIFFLPDTFSEFPLGHDET